MVLCIGRPGLGAHWLVDAISNDQNPVAVSNRGSIRVDASWLGGEDSRDL